MGFPFLAPLKTELVKKLKEREDNISYANSLMPFIILSSATVVTNSGKKVEEIIEKHDYLGAFQGCVVTNTTDIKNLYQTGKTLVGYDLNGKPIEVEGETNRRISTPIIVSMELDTDGNNNTLKTAQLQIKVFSLKQLEMFELFFLRPAMKVVIEWGVNTDIKNKSNTYIIGSKLFAKKNFEAYLAAYIDIFSHTDNAYKKAKSEYLKTIQDTNYDYDYMAGSVSNYTFSTETDGTYNIMLEVSAGNELQLWMPTQQASEGATTEKPADNKNAKPFQSWVNKIAADMNYPILADSKIFNETNDFNEFFNWGVLNEKQEDAKFSKDLYVSFRLLIKIISELTVYKQSEKLIRIVYKFDGKDVIPINSSPFIISTTKDFILPGQLPSIEVGTGKDEKNKIIINNKKSINSPINGYSFNITNEIIEKGIELTNIDDSNDVKYNVASTSGNLLNVFFNWTKFVEIYTQSYALADVMSGLLSTINDNMFGLCDLQFSAPDDASSASSNNTIIDAQLLTLPKFVPQANTNEMYRFKIGAIGSIVKEFEFNMELDALAQAQALYSTQLGLDNIKTGTSEDKLPNTTKAYAQANEFKQKNQDGYYSINAIEIKLVEDSEKWNNILNPSGSVTNKDKNGDGENEITNMNEVLSQNFIKFKPTKGSATSGNNLIYTDASLIQSKINKPAPGTTALTFLEITLAIDGIAGLSSGEYFHIDGVPEIYNRNGYFQITNVKHGLDENGWKTTIVAGYRITNI